MAQSISLIWTRSWFLQLIVIGIFLLFLVNGSIQRFDDGAYDWALSYKTAAPDERIVIVTIDEQSISALGRWPWSREIHADFIQRLNQANPESIAYLPFFFEPQNDRGYHALLELNEHIVSSSVLNFSASEPDTSNFWDQRRSFASRLTPAKREQLLSQIDEEKEEVVGLVNLIQSHLQVLDVDAKLAQAIVEANNILLPLYLNIGDQRAQKRIALPDYIAQSVAAVKINRDTKRSPQIEANRASVPISAFGKVSYGIGHLNLLPDSDGVVRSDALVIDYFGQRIPSLSLLIAAQSIGLKGNDIVINPGHSIEFGNVRLHTDPLMRINPHSYEARKEAGFRTVSFVDVLNGTIDRHVFRDKLVVVGTTAPGLGDSLVTASSKNLPPPMFLANSVSSILQNHYIAEPGWSQLSQSALYGLMMLVMVMVLPRLSGVFAFVTVVLLASLLGAVQIGVLHAQHIWLAWTGPIILILFGYVSLVISRFLRLEKLHLKTQFQSNENHLRLGLTYQGQGQLELAFNELKRCDPDIKILDALYSLGLDFERKRQLHKANSVYEYIFSIDPKYRDVKARVEMLISQGEAGFVAGVTDTFSNSEDNTVIANSVELEKPVIGRYKIVNELGRGGMGIVYEAVDPKINRTLALKTFELVRNKDQDFEDDSRARFLREAEAIGKINHRNIVTVYDVGEEHDLAFIAMELLHGKELSFYTYRERLLPHEDVVKIGLACADALHFAHQSSVIHRDIKPSNIMFDEANKSVKITDFGIAHMMSAQVTKSGLVIGTAGYMSPEQLRGESIDGRSDIFSLAVTLYHLLCGEKPFASDNFAAYGYSVCHEPETPLADISDGNIDRELSDIIAKGLMKEPNSRYQTAKEMCDALSAYLRRN